MENEVVRQSNLTPASFENPRNKLTKEQASLMSFLKEKVHSNTVITRESILEFYLSNVKVSTTYKKWIEEYDPVRQRFVCTGEFEIRQWKDYYNINQCALLWFKNNLGSVILKGKLLILPVIDIE